MSETNYQRTEVIAKLFGITVRRVQQLVQEGILKTEKVQGTTGRLFDLYPTIQAYIEHLSNKAYSRNKGEKEQELKEKKLEVEISLKESQNELHRLKTDIQAGRYVAIEDVKRDYNDFFAIFKRFALCLPNRVGGLVNGYVDPMVTRQIEADLVKEITAMLNTFIIQAVVEQQDKIKDEEI